MGGHAGTREEEFRAFYAHQYPAVAGYCWSLVRDRELAHDLAQESFTRLYARWIRVEDPAGYVFRISTNLVRRAWRARADQANVMVALRAERLTAAAPDDVDAISLRTALDGLPSRLREVVLLYYFADLPVNDIAGYVARPVGTVKRQLAEARGKLADLLAVQVG